MNITLQDFEGSNLPDEIAERAVAAANAAQEAFWQTIVEHFPEVKSGDFAPDAAHYFDRACAGALTHWIVGNYPMSEYEVLVRFKVGVDSSLDGFVDEIRDTVTNMGAFDPVIGWADHAPDDGNS